MYGLFQTTFYFGYMALFSIALGILCGMAFPCLSFCSYGPYLYYSRAFLSGFLITLSTFQPPTALSWVVKGIFYGLGIENFSLKIFIPVLVWLWIRPGRAEPWKSYLQCVDGVKTHVIYWFVFSKMKLANSFMASSRVVSNRIFSISHFNNLKSFFDLKFGTVFITLLLKANVKLLNHNFRSFCVLISLPSCELAFCFCRNIRLFGYKCIRQKDLFNRENRLNIIFKIST